MKKRSCMVSSSLKCRECGGTFPIMRQRGHMREKGHIKDMWCPYCKKEVKFVERGKWYE